MIIEGINIFMYTWLTLQDKKLFNFSTFLMLQLIFQVYPQIFFFIFEKRPDIIKRIKGDYFVTRICFYVVYINLNIIVYVFIYFILQFIFNFHYPAHCMVLLLWVFIKDCKLCIITKRMIYLFLVFYNFYFISVNIASFYESDNKDFSYIPLFFFIYVKDYSKHFPIVLKVLINVIILDFFRWDLPLTLGLLIYFKRDISWAHFIVWVYTLVLVPLISKIPILFLKKAVWLLTITLVIWVFSKITPKWVSSKISWYFSKITPKWVYSKMNLFCGFIHSRDFEYVYDYYPYLLIIIKNVSKI